MNLEDFIETLKELVVYNKEEHKHYMGNTVLTNRELNGMLELLLEDEYTSLNGTKREKIRERIFKELRGD